MTLWVLNFSVQSISCSKFLPQQIRATACSLIYERLITLYPCSIAVLNNYWGSISGIPFVPGKNKSNLFWKVERLYFIKCGRSVFVILLSVVEGLILRVIILLEGSLTFDVFLTDLH